MGNVGVCKFLGVGEEAGKLGIQGAIDEYNGYI